MWRCRDETGVDRRRVGAARAGAGSDSGGLSGGADRCPDPDARTPAHVHSRDRAVRNRLPACGDRAVAAVDDHGPAVQGVGAALLAPSTLALLATSFPEG